MRKIVNIKQIYDDNELLEENKREIKVYEYKELTESARKKAREEMEQDKINSDIGNDQFKILLDDNIECLFPKSNLKYEYSLNSCQGDGFNLYGEVRYINMKLYVYTFVSEDKEKEIIKNEVFCDFSKASDKLIGEYNNCLKNMDLLNEEDTGYTHNIKINSKSESIRAYVTDDLTGETCVWTINSLDANL